MDKTGQAGPAGNSDSPEMTGSSADLAPRLATICGDAHISAGSDIDPRYRRDWLGLAESHPAIVVRPANTAEVAAVMTLCAETRTAVVPLVEIPGWPAAPLRQRNRISCCCRWNV